MRFFLLLLIFFLCRTPCAGAQNVPPPTGRYDQVFEGTIGGRPVSVYFRDVLKDTSGWYRYRGTPQRIRLVFRRGQKNHLFFSEIGSDSVRHGHLPVWDCRYAAGQLTGYRYIGKNATATGIRLRKVDTEGSFLFRQVTRDTTAWLWAEDTSAPHYDLGITVPVALGTGVAMRWLNQQIRALMSLDTSDVLSQNIEDRISHAILEYRDVNQYREAGQSGPSMNWVNETGGRILFNQNGYVIVANEGYQYAGGAHGSSWAVFSVLDVKKKRQLSLSDIIHADSTVLRPLLEKHFRIFYGLQPEDSLTGYLFENRLMPNQNFYFTNDGLTFVYNQYEVAPYVMGIISITLPWRELRSYLIPEFKNRMHL